MTDTQTKMLINGELVAGDGGALQMLAPVTSEVTTSVPEESIEQVEASAQSAGKAFM